MPSTTFSEGGIERTLSAMQRLACTERTSGSLPKKLQRHISELRRFIGSILETTCDAITANVTSEAMRLQVIACFKAGPRNFHRSIFIQQERRDELLQYLKVLQADASQCLDCTGKNLDGITIATRLTACQGSNLAQAMLQDPDHELLLKFLADNGVDMPVDEVKKIFTHSILLRIIRNKIRDPLGAITEVARNIKEKLSTRNIRKELEKHGIQLSAEEVDYMFLPMNRIYLAISYRSRPLDGVLIVVRHMRETLTDEKMLGVIQEENIKMDTQMLHEIFTEKRRIHFALSNTGNPLKGIRNTARKMGQLTDEKIQQHLRTQGIEMEEGEIRTIFTERLRWDMAVNSNDPLRDAAALAYHLRTTFTDENILSKIREAGIVIDENDLLQKLTLSVRIRFAYHHRKDPIGAMIAWIHGDLQCPRRVRPGECDRRKLSRKNPSAVPCKNNQILYNR